MSGLRGYEGAGEAGGDEGENFTLFSLSVCNGMFFYLEVSYIPTL